MTTTGLIPAAFTNSLIAVMGAALLATPASAQDYTISVTLRDFRHDHPDFGTVATTLGLHHGNVALDLDEDGKPAFVGGGFLAQRAWQDRNGNVISPHLFNTCNFLTPILVDPGRGRLEGGESSFMVTVDQRVRVDRHSMIDSFDSNEGPYSDETRGDSAMVRVNGTGMDRGFVSVRKSSSIRGDVMVHPDADPAQAVLVSNHSEITGTVGNLESPAEIPAVEAPLMEGMPASVGKVKHKGGSHAITENTHVESLVLDKGASMTVAGDVTIMCDDRMVLDNRSTMHIDGNVTLRCEALVLDDESTITLAEGAMLTVYATERVVLDDESMLNMEPGNPQQVRILMPAPAAAAGELDDDDHDDDDDRHDSHVRLDDKSQMAAWVHGAAASLRVADRSAFFGSFMGRRVDLRNHSMLHMDSATAASEGREPGEAMVIYEPVECELGDRAGAAGVASDGDVLSAGTFAEWWRDILGVNLSTVQSIYMWHAPWGEYLFHQDDWRPIDGLLLGNEGQAHNYFFTAEMDTTFTYVEGAGDFFELRNTDDSYVFVNGRLVIDNGGYGFNKVMYIEMDRLGLTDGETTGLQVFHAQRQQGLAIFSIRTSLALEDAHGGLGAVTGILDD